MHSDELPKRSLPNECSMENLENNALSLHKLLPAIGGGGGGAIATPTHSPAGSVAINAKTTLHCSPDSSTSAGNCYTFH